MKKKAFSLIEVLIALALIGIMVSVAIPAMLDSKKRALRAKYDSIITTVATAVDQYYSLEAIPGTDEIDTQPELAKLSEYIGVPGAIPSPAFFYTPASYQSLGWGAWPTGAKSLLEGLPGYPDGDMRVDPGVLGGVDANGVATGRREPRIISGGVVLPRP